MCLLNATAEHQVLFSKVVNYTSIHFN
uniref:Uncharacterized protein n=1 Tax=Anguilla anguilla TaxID=7936 RepID=A0A0E9TFP7_ANGAN